MTDKQINRWLRHQFSPIGWLLLLYYGFMTLLATVTTFVEMATQSVRSFASGNFAGSLDWNAVNGNAWGYITAMAVGFAILRAWKGRDYLTQQIFVRHGTIKAKSFLCFLFFCMGAQLINGLWISLLEMLMNFCGGSVMPVLEQVAGSTDTFSMFLYASILAPIWEEFLFRGCILRTLSPYGKRFAIWGSAILFGLFHGNLLQMPYAILVGLLLGYVAVEYSIFWAMAIHMFNNLVLADLLNRLTASWSEMAVGTFNLILLGGSAVLSLIILIKNRGSIRAYREGEYLDRRCLNCFFTSPGILILTVFMVISMTTMFFL